MGQGVLPELAETPLADNLGIVPEPVIPPAVVLAIPVALVLVNLVAALPARTAARTSAALALRAE